MDYQVTLLLLTFLIQGLRSAPSTPHSIHKRDNGPRSVDSTKDTTVTLSQEDAKIFAEIQRLKETAEQFQSQTLKFIDSLTDRVSTGAYFKKFADQLSNSVKAQTETFIKSLDDSRNIVVDRMTKMASDGLRQGKDMFNNNMEYVQGTLSDLQQKGNQLYQSGIEYLLPWQSKNTLRERSIENRFELSLEEDMNEQTQRLRDSDLQLSEEDLQHLQRRDNNPANGGNTANPSNTANVNNAPGNGVTAVPNLSDLSDKTLAAVVVEQLSGVRDSSADAVKSMTILTTGGVISLLDALSAVLSSTANVGYHARMAISGIHRSSANAVNSVIDTAGSIASGTLDKTGQVVEAMHLGPRHIPSVYHPAAFNDRSNSNFGNADHHTDEVDSHAPTTNRNTQHSENEGAEVNSHDVPNADASNHENHSNGANNNNVPNTDSINHEDQSTGADSNNVSETDASSNSADSNNNQNIDASSNGDHSIGANTDGSNHEDQSAGNENRGAKISDHSNAPVNSDQPSGNNQEEPSNVNSNTDAGANNGVETSNDNSDTDANNTNNNGGTSNASGNADASIKNSEGPEASHVNKESESDANKGSGASNTDSEEGTSNVNNNADSGNKDRGEVPSADGNAGAVTGNVGETSVGNDNAGNGNKNGAEVSETPKHTDVNHGNEGKTEEASGNEPETGANEPGTEETNKNEKNHIDGNEGPQNSENENKAEEASHKEVEGTKEGHSDRTETPEGNESATDSKEKNESVSKNDDNGTIDNVNKNDPTNEQPNSVENGDKPEQNDTATQETNIKNNP